ncbi:SDR family NAD(P)-dependent oxidoreductase [Rhizobium phaseoli]|uniref:SDR family NAD(P)-dependent oxidoreductase n=1 Tax=Rhizobium phaseoli TaxID=396 RepID=UPI000BE9CBD0|nr:SDR family NAD(P)-dependent oxidoreductase [Rhizobium phaseoli]MDK4724747.1 SDR family NAD(P)-dependent oxidoreductase [Rhizobium phaseoli]NKE86253.1 SDR family NAD(P)-dependent oxidoreductase [Rhizobium phaseoli]PDS71911.1 oxidoreductase [Rhizobium phaseoli]
MADNEAGKGLAVVTGASTGIGYELAKCAAQDGYDLIIAADEDRINQAAAHLKEFGTAVEAVEADLSTSQGVDRLVERITGSGRSVDLLMANAGCGLGKAFLDQDFAQARKVDDTNITGTIDLIHAVGNQMRSRGEGRILLTGSIAGFMPGSYQAVYNATKAFINSFSFALREELKDSGVTVSCLMPGATETEFFKRAGLLDTAIGQSKKDDAGEVARIGYDAMMDGEGDVVSGWKNKLQAAVANVTPASVLAHQHSKMAEPGSGRK